MERIKQAVEQARRARLAEREQVSTVVRPVPEFTPEPGPVFEETLKPPVSPAVLRKHRIMLGSEDDPAVTAYKILRTRVLQRMTERGWRTLAITSPGPDEGKTLTAINLAVSLAKETRFTVLLVDLDLRRPSIHRCFGYTPQAGIGDYLLEAKALSEIVFSPGIDRLLVLPGNTPVAESSELLSSPRMTRLIDELKTRHPSCLVLFDLPPLLSTDDALAFSPLVDAALVVVEEGKTTKEAMTRSSELLAATNFLGTVLNKSDESITPYG